MQFLSPTTKHTDSIKQPDNNYTVRLPTDLLTMFFMTYFSLDQRVPLGLVCKRWHNITGSETLYHKGQLLGRLLILNEIVRHHGASDGPGAKLRQKVNVYLGTKPDFRKLAVPHSSETSFTVLFKAAKLVRPTFKMDEHIKDEDLPVAIQNYLEESLPKDHPPRGSLLNIGTFLRGEFDVDSKDAYECQAIHDCLAPLLDRSIDECVPTKGLPAWFNAEYTLPVFSAVMQALSRSDKIKRIEFNLAVTGVKTLDKLVMFNHNIINQALAHAKGVESVCFANNSRNDTVEWINGSGLESIREGLINCPHLKKLAFTELTTSIDEHTALKLAQIVLDRQKNKKASRLEFLEFGPASITGKGINVLIHALKDYPVPLVIFFGPRNDSFPGFPFFAEDLVKIYESNKNLRVVASTNYPDWIEHTIYVWDRSYHTEVGIYYKQAHKYFTK